MLKKLSKKASKMFFVFCVTVSVIVMSSISVFADATTPTSMLDTETEGILADFAADIVPTVTAIIAIVVPASLAVWAIFLGVRKGLGMLKSAAKRG